MQPLSTLSAAAAPARSMPNRSYREKRTPRLASATARSAVWQKTPGIFPGCVRGADHAVELALDLLRQRIEGFAVRQRNRKIGRAEEKSVDPGRVDDRLEVFQRGAGFDHGERNDVIVGFAQVDV